MNIFMFNYEMHSSYRGKESFDFQNIAYFSKEPTLKDLKSVIEKVFGGVVVSGHDMSDEDIDHLALNKEFDLIERECEPLCKLVIHTLEVVEN